VNDAARNRVLAVLAAACALVALYAPTSTGGVISQPLYMLNVALVGGALAVMVVMRGRVWSAWQLGLAFLIVALPMVFTAVGEFTALSPGMAILFGCTATLFLVDVRDVRPGRLGLVALATIDIVTVVLGTALVLNVGAADAFVKTHYAFFYPHLLMLMLDWYNKPVLTFGTHSLSAFFYWLMFYLHLEGYRHTGRHILLLAGIYMLGLCASLWSTTGVIFTAVGVIQLLVLFTSRLSARWAVVGGLTFAAASVVLFVTLAPPVDDLVEIATRGVLGDRSAGLLARYAAEGNLAATMNYLIEQPWRPIGLTYSPDLFYGDSGFVMYALRGSVALPVFIYFALFVWLRHNLIDRRVALVVCAGIVAFEIGFTPLVFFRFFGVLPFLLIWWNEWQRLGQQPSRPIGSA